MLILIKFSNRLFLSPNEAQNANVFVLHNTLRGKVAME